MSEQTSANSVEWLTIPELVTLLGVTQSRVRQLIEEKQLIGSKRNGTFAVPALFLDDDAPLGSLRGTIIALNDSGFTDDEAIDWLLNVDDTIGIAPIAALHQGRKSEVRRVARTLI